MDSKFARYYIPLIPGLLTVLLLISYLLEPPNLLFPFDWTTSPISRLGWPAENVVGWIFFSLAFLCLGFLSLFLIPTYVHKFATLQKRWSRLLSSFLLLASIGEILIGAIPNLLTPDLVFIVLHFINASLYFLCSYGVAIILGILFAQKKHRWMVSRQVAIVYAILVVYGLFATIAMIVLSPFWEWHSFFLSLFLVLVPLYFQMKKTPTK